MADDRFVRSVQEEIKKQEQQRDLAASTGQRHTEILKNDGPAIWKALLKEAEETVHEVNGGFSGSRLEFESDAHANRLRYDATFNPIWGA